MKCAGKLFARTLLGQSQLGRKPAQLKRSSFKLGMTSAEGLLSFFMQHAITFLVASHLEHLLGTPALSDIQLNSGKVDYLSLTIAMCLAQTLYPRHCAVGPDDAECGVKGIHVHMLEAAEEV